MASASPDWEMDDLLTPSSAHHSDNLRDLILQKTTRRIRFHRRVGQMTRIGALTLSFLAGMGTLWLFRADKAPEPKVVIVEVPVEVVREVAPDAQKPVMSPDQLEVEAEKSLVQTDSARQFREAGDRYLKEEGDYDGALRCYRNFLEKAERVELNIVETDTWLLMSLKQSMQTETGHEYKDD